MNHNMLHQLVKLDAECFDRLQNPRSLENVQTMLDSSPGGCFILFIRDELVGYIFTHRMGSVGYLGPLGVKPAYRGQGYGKCLVEQGIKALEVCSAIGLEALPESGRNLGVYINAGFSCTYPTLMFSRRNRGGDLTPNIITARGLEHNGQLKRFFASFDSLYPGYSLEKDLFWAITRCPGDCYFYLDAGEVVGFMAYTPDLYPYVWGAISPIVTEKCVFNQLFSALEKSHPDMDLKVRVNSRYQRIDWLMTSGFKVERGFIRMLLPNKQDGLPNQAAEGLVLRAWMG